MMKNLIANTKHKQDNGDATSTYDCELSRDDIPLWQFAAAIHNSVNKQGWVFNEWWATVHIYFAGDPTFLSRASYSVYGSCPPDKEFKNVQMDNHTANICDIIDKYGKCVVVSCYWNGGWGGGSYWLQIAKPTTAQAAQQPISGNPAGKQTKEH